MLFAHAARALLALLLGLAASAQTAHAICDVIPQPEASFRGAQGSVNRVYVTDGDPVTLSADANGCVSGNALGGNSVITHVFTARR